MGSVSVDTARQVSTAGVIWAAVTTSILKAATLANILVDDLHLLLLISCAVSWPAAIYYCNKNNINYLRSLKGECRLRLATQSLLVVLLTVILVGCVTLAYLSDWRQKDVSVLYLAALCTFLEVALLTPGRGFSGVNPRAD